MFLKDKVAIVTGAGQGIGAAIAQAYAQEGAKVAVVDMNAEAAETVAADIRLAGGTAKGFACNVAERESVNKMAAGVTAEWGRVDILVNNAGITRTAMLHKMTPEQWQQVIDVHMNGSFYCLQAVVNGMIERKSGRIINVTTSLGTIQRKGNAPYGPSKGAIEAETLIFAEELAGTGVTCNSLIPGGAAATAFVPKNFLTERKLVDPKVMRAPIVWLASELSDGHTGERYVGNRWDGKLTPDKAAAGALEAPVYRTPEGAQRASRAWDKR